MRAATELRRRRVEGGVRYFEPANEKQLEALAFSKRGALVLGGNRSGKTVCGAVETAFRLCGKHPYKKKPVPKGPIKVWACSQTLPGVSDKPHVQLEELRRWLPRDALRSGIWEKSYSPSARTLALADGSVVEFKGYDQGLLQFESAKIHFAWFDEEPTDRQIFTSTMLRLLDYGGQWMMTLTPVLSLQGRGWVEDGLYEKRADPGCNYETFQLSTTENPHLDQGDIAEVRGGLTEEEDAVRMHGSFARIGGRVLAELRPDIHFVQPFIPPRSWRHWLVVDPGYRNATAAIFAAADPDGALYLYNEHYVKEQLPAYHLEMLHAMHQGHGAPEIDTLMDPASWARVGTVLGRSNRTVHEEYMIGAQKCGAKWFAPRPASNEERGVWRIKRYLMPRPRPDGFSVPMIYVCENLFWWRWEAERWTWPMDRSGMTASNRPVAERPRERDNHLMDCTKYLVNEMPEPETVADPPKPRTWSETASKHFTSLIKKVKKKR